MRFDKLTTKFQQALADAQSLALGNDNGFIEPQHLLAALLEQEDGGTASLLARAGVAVPQAARARSRQSIDRLPKVEGTGGEISISRDLNNLLNLTDKEAHQARRPVHRQRAVPARAAPTTRARPAGCSRSAASTRKALEDAIEAVRGGGERRLAGSRRPARGARRSTRSTSPSARATASSTR